MKNSPKATSYIDPWHLKLSSAFSAMLIVFRMLRTKVFITESLKKNRKAIFFEFLFGDHL